MNLIGKEIDLLVDFPLDYIFHFACIETILMTMEKVIKFPDMARQPMGFSSCVAVCFGLLPSDYVTTFRNADYVPACSPRMAISKSYEAMACQ